METIQKKFFNLLALVKYVLESKACIPFPKEENTRPYKKPYGYGLYQDKEDRYDFQNLEILIKKEIEDKVKTFHYFRSKFEDLSKSILILSGIKGGQNTITITLFRILMTRLKSSGIEIRDKKIVDLYTLVSQNFKGYISNNPPGFWKKLFNFSKKSKIAELHNIVFMYQGSEMLISTLVYYVDGKMSFVSFVENSIKATNGELVFEKIEMEVDRVIRLLPIMDIL